MDKVLLLREGSTDNRFVEAVSYAMNGFQNHTPEIHAGDPLYVGAHGPADLLNGHRRKACTTMTTKLTAISSSSEIRCK